MCTEAESQLSGVSYDKDTNPIGFIGLGPTFMISFKFNYFLTLNVFKSGFRASTYEFGVTYTLLSGGQCSPPENQTLEGNEMAP